MWLKSSHIQLNISTSTSFAFHLVTSEYNSSSCEQITTKLMMFPSASAVPPIYTFIAAYLVMNAKCYREILFSLSLYCTVEHYIRQISSQM